MKLHKPKKEKEDLKNILLDVIEESSPEYTRSIAKMIQNLDIFNSPGELSNFLKQLNTEKLKEEHEPLTSLELTYFVIFSFNSKTKVEKSMLLDLVLRLSPDTNGFESIEDAINHLRIDTLEEHISYILKAIPILDKDVLITDLRKSVTCCGCDCEQ
jgi:hypothetical protein